MLKSGRWSRRSLTPTPRLGHLKSKFSGHLLEVYEERIKRGLLKSLIRYVIRILGRSFLLLFHTVSTQVYTTVNVQNTRFLTSFGNFCSAIRQITAFTVLSTELIRRNNVAVASGGLANAFTRVEYQGIVMTVKVFPVFSPQKLEAKQVRVE